MLVKQLAAEYGLYPHHEDYPESAREAQGQLKSHLPGSKPVIKGLGCLDDEESLGELSRGIAAPENRMPNWHADWYRTAATGVDKRST